MIEAKVEKEKTSWDTDPGVLTLPGTKRQAIEKEAIKGHEMSRESWTDGGCWWYLRRGAE